MMLHVSPFSYQQFPGNFSAGFSAQTIQANQQVQPVPALVTPVPQSPNGQIPVSLPPAVQPVQLVDYNGIPILVFGAMYEQFFFTPSPTPPASSVATTFTYQTVAPQTPPFSPLNGQQFFPPPVEIIGQPQPI